MTFKVMQIVSIVVSSNAIISIFKDLNNQNKCLCAVVPDSKASSWLRLGDGCAFFDTGLGVVVVAHTARAVAVAHVIRAKAFLIHIIGFVATADGAVVMGGSVVAALAVENFPSEVISSYL